MWARTWVGVVASLVAVFLSGSSPPLSAQPPARATPWAGPPSAPAVVPPLDWTLPGSSIARELTALHSFSSKALLLVDDFEDVDLAGWLSGGGPCTASVTSATAGSGTYSMQIQGGCDHYAGRYYQMPSFQASQISLQVRADAPLFDQGYFVAGDDNVATDGGVIFFWAASNGHWMMFDGTLLYDCGPATPGQWTDVSFYLDWGKRVSQVTIDGLLRQVNVPFRSATATFLTRVHAYNWNLGDALDSAYWDQIVMSSPPPTTLIFSDSFEAGDAGSWTTSVPAVPRVIRMFRSQAIPGAIGGRGGADLWCARLGISAGLGVQYWYRAFLSVSSSDEIRDMPANYGVPTDRRIIGSTGVKIADDWTDLLDGSIDATLLAALVHDGPWYSGSNTNGSIAANNCQGWTASSVLQGRYGSSTTTAASWLSMGSDVCGLPEYPILCLAWRE